MFYELEPDPDKLHPPPLAVYDLIEVPADCLVFIVMEEWYPQFLYEIPGTLRLFLGALRQCIEVRVRSHRVCRSVRAERVST